MTTGRRRSNSCFFLSLGYTINLIAMHTIFNKLNLKHQPAIFAFNVPASFEPVLQEVAATTHVIRDSPSPEGVTFAIGFVTELQQVHDLIHRVGHQLEGDALLWLCYPKSSAKRYRCNFNRDTGWVELGKFGLEPVRQVAIDEDWSALRFRKVAYIKKITRRESTALTPEAKARTDQKGV